MKRLVLGFDPGAKGIGFSIDEDRKTSMIDIAKVESLWDVARWTGERWMLNRVLGAAIENVHSMPGNGVKSMFKFGYNAGYLRGICEANLIQVTLVSPQEWQRFHALGGRWGPLGCSPDQETRARKKAHRDKAKELFPELSPTVETADGMLIAEWLWQKKLGGRRR